MLALGVVSPAAAEPMDSAFERFVTDASAGCRTATGVYVPGTDSAGPAVCQPDNLKFKRFVNQLGFAFAPSAMHSARTTGYGGFDVGVEATYTKVSNSKDYWKLGTQGSGNPSTNLASIRNNGPDSLLQLYSVRVRKGFGFGLEVSGMVGFMPKTSLLGGGADVRMSLLEGFRRGLLGIFPDVAVGGGVRTITGTPQLQLTIASLDAQISKPLPIQDASVLTPWVGYQHLWIFGDSGIVDLTPATNAQGYCGYAGSNTPTTSGPADPAKTVSDGQPICTAPGPHPQADFNNNAVFQAARLKRHRVLFGMNYRYEMVRVGAQFITDLVAPSEAQTKDQDKADLKGEERQWTLAFELGASF
ncbi:MAG: hypothetical protein QM756_29085 [Polyangiaceae bacterium]